jgi:RNA polymerase sigma factor (sigma-70 family)
MIDKNTTDTYLAALVKNSADQEALNLLINRHSGICYKIYNKYFHNNYSSIARDVEEQKDSLIYHAAKTFNPKIGAKFSTWLGNIITYACLNACNEHKKEVAFEDDILKYLADSESNDKLYSLSKDSDLISHIKDIIETSNDNTSKEVIKMRYFTEDSKVKTFKEIADHFGVSTQTVVNWHDKFIMFLKNKLKSESNVNIV